MQARSARYEIRRPVEFRVRSGGTAFLGRGRTVNISREGLLFETDNLPRIGEKIECLIEMGPGLVDQRENVNLQVQGITVRNSDGKVAVAVKKYRLRPIHYSP